MEATSNTGEKRKNLSSYLLSKLESIFTSSAGLIKIICNWLSEVYRSKRWFGCSVRFLILCGSIIVAAAVGALLGSFFFTDGALDLIGPFVEFLNKRLPSDTDIAKSLYVALGAVSVGLVLSLIKELLDLIPHTFDYIFFKGGTSEASKGYARTVVTVAIFAAGIIVSIIAYGRYHDDGQEPSHSQNFNLLLPQAETVGENSSSSSISFLTMFYEDATEDAVEKGAGPGLGITPDQDEMLKNLSETVTACSASQGEHASITLIGNASSEPFDELLLKRSNELNRRLANLRAEKVASLMAAHSKRFINEHQVSNSDLALPKIHVHKWRSYHDMVRARRFSDRDSEGNYIDERARFTRSVEIKLRDAGECSFQSIL